MREYNNAVFILFYKIYRINLSILNFVNTSCTDKELPMNGELGCAWPRGQFLNDFWRAETQVYKQTHRETHRDMHERLGNFTLRWNLADGLRERQ